MAAINSFRDLLVWQKAMHLAVECHEAVRRLSARDQQVLGFQLRKSAVSIPSNIAEGSSRHSTAFYIQHLWMSHASLAELETQLTLAERLKLIPPDRAEVLIADAQEVGRMINGLVKSLARTSGS